MIRRKRVQQPERGEAVVVLTMSDGAVITSPPTSRSRADLIRQSLLARNAGQDLSEASWLPAGFDASQVAGVDVTLVPAPALDSAPFPGSIAY